MKMRKVVRVFVGSPGDVIAEREVLEEIVKELNDLWSASLGIYLQLIKWETHSYPDTSSDPQAVINEQIGDDYDVFVGILWSRFGTPTPRAESGTIEEFERAYKKYQAAPDSVKIMIYFKDEPISPSKINPEQLAGINKFRDSLGELGTLHWSFDNIDSFSKFLRMHLTRQMQYWKDKPIKLSAAVPDNDIGPKSLQDQINQLEPAEEVGFLDLVEKGTENFEMLSEVANRITEELNDLAEYQQSNTEEMQNVDISKGKQEFKKAKRLVNQMAGRLESFNKRIQDETPSFREHFSTAIDSYGKAATLLTDFDTDIKQDILDALDVVSGIKKSSVGAKEAIGEFRKIIASLPRVTTRFNRAKRRCIEVLDNLDQEFESGIMLTDEVESLMRKLIQ